MLHALRPTRPAGQNQNGRRQNQNGCAPDQQSLDAIHKLQMFLSWQSTHNGMTDHS
jgi:hypothetical protein